MGVFTGRRGLALEFFHFWIPKLHCQKEMSSRVRIGTIDLFGGASGFLGSQRLPIYILQEDVLVWEGGSWILNLGFFDTLQTNANAILAIARMRFSGGNGNERLIWRRIFCFPTA